MSLLDMDERLLDLADVIDLVYSPLVDLKEFPPDVDVTLVEGAVSSEEDLHKIKHIRARTKMLVSLGDCAVTGNVPSMRNPFGPNAMLARAYLNDGRAQPAHSDSGRARAAADMSGRFIRRQSRCVRARLPAVGRHDLLRAHRTAGRSRCPISAA